MACTLIMAMNWILKVNKCIKHHNISINIKFGKKNIINHLSFHIRNFIGLPVVKSYNTKNHEPNNN